MEKVIKTIFMGTPDFAVKPLLSLITSPDFKIAAVFTNPDEPTGRRQILSAPPVKKTAEKFNLKFYQPNKIKEAENIIKEIAPDLIVVVAYGHLIPQSILDIPRYGCVNIHASLLPKYRGAACMQAPILNGDKESGITIMKMEAGLDTGPILKQGRLELRLLENIATLGQKLSDLSAEILIPTLRDYIKGEIKEIVQDERSASYVKMIKKEDGLIDFSKSAIQIERETRAYYTWPGSWFEWPVSETQKKKVKIIEADQEILRRNFAEPGQFFRHEKKLGLQCGQDALIILSLQIEGKEAITSQAFLNGYKSLIK